MKKTYISPAINVVQIQVTMAAASNEFEMDNNGGDASSSLGRHNSIQWIDDDEEEI